MDNYGTSCPLLRTLNVLSAWQEDSEKFSLKKRDHKIKRKRPHCFFKKEDFFLFIRKHFISTAKRKKTHDNLLSLSFWNGTLSISATSKNPKPASHNLCFSSSVRAFQRATSLYLPSPNNPSNIPPWTTAKPPPSHSGDAFEEGSTHQLLMHNPRSKLNRQSWKPRSSSTDNYDFFTFHCYTHRRCKLKTHQKLVNGIYLISVFLWFFHAIFLVCFYLFSFERYGPCCCFVVWKYKREQREITWDCEKQILCLL